MNLIRLSRMTGDSGLDVKASALSRSFGGTVSQSPSAYTWFLCGLDLVSQSHEVVIVGDDEAEDTRRMISVLQSRYLPSVIVLQVAPGPRASALTELALFTQSLFMIDGKATAYVCSGNTCSAPVTDPESVLALIEPREKS